MAKSYLHGAKFKVYGYNLPEGSSAENLVMSKFAESTEIKEIELIMSDITGSTTVSEKDYYLYKWNKYSGYSEYQETTAQILDSASKNWQLGTIFYMYIDTYGGKVPTRELLNLFPYAYKFEDFGYNMLYFTRDDINTVWVLGYELSNPTYGKKSFSFNKQTLKTTGNDCGLNVLLFYPNDGPFASQGFVSSDLYFYPNKLFSRFGSWPYGSDDSYLTGLRFETRTYDTDIKAVFEENYIPTNDPYDKGGSSGKGGGTGTFDGTSDNVDFPSLPTLSASETGFISLFNPTIGQLKNLSSYMWSDAFSIEAFKKMFADPMDAILGLSIVPVAVPEGGSGEITVGNIPTGITMTKASSQYVEVDCGTLDVKEYWGAYLDYDPYTKAELYLPYCGIHPIKTDDIMNKSVHIKYHVDILSGSCCAYVKCGESVLYTFSGSCSCSIPITSADFTSTIVGAISIASSIGTMVATGGMSAPISMGGIVDAVDSAASAADIVNMKPSVERSGSIGSMAGMLAIQTPYLILTRPNQCLPKNQNTYEGYPAYITETITNLSGYTIFEEIHLNGMSCTDAEKNEIENLLKSGVIL